MKTKLTLLAALLGSVMFAGVSNAQTTDTPVVPDRDQIRERLHALMTDYRDQNADLVAARERLRLALKDASEEERKALIAQFREQYADRIDAARQARKEIRTNFLQHRREIRQRLEQHREGMVGDGAGNGPGAEG